MSTANRTTILIIDDDEDIKRLLRLKLEQQDYSIITADDGNAGLNKLEKFEPDMVIVDVDMPGMNGFEFCQHAKQQQQFRYIPLMVLTASADDASINRAYESGATDFMTKPVNHTKLAHRIRFALKASAMATRLAEREKLLLSAQKTAHMGEWTYDINSGDFYCSAEAARLFGLANEACRQYEPLLDLITDSNRDRVLAVFEQPSMQDTDYSLEFTVTTPNKQTRRIRQTVDVDTARNKKPRLLGVFQDVTELREAENKVRSLSMYDRLTGLPNRIYFQRMLTKTIVAASRQQHKFALIKLNIDNFMRINANLGHEVGDQILTEISKRLVCSMQSDDMLPAEYADPNPGAVMLGHLGADKFALVLNEIENYDAVAELVQQLIEELNHNLVIEDRQIHLSTSIGISIYPDDASNASDLLKNASQALAHAKELGPNKHSYHYYSNELNDRSRQRLLIENLLAQALDKEEFMLYYQPKVALHDSSIVGAEALLRWKNAELGMVSPASFIPIAENKGLMEKITDWVIHAACQQLLVWEQQGFRLPSIAVNLESSVLLQQHFCEHLIEKLHDASIDLSRLDFEITESTLMNHMDNVLPKLRELKGLGSSISIDDFGTGYSSLSYLKTLPITNMKIDKSFMRDVMHNEDDAIIVNAVISLAHNLDKKVIAEGVEDEAQIEFLKQRQCDVVQGYYYSQPLPADEFLLWCEQHNQCQRQADKIQLIN